MLETFLEFLLYGLYTNAGGCSFVCWPAVAGYLFYAPDEPDGSVQNFRLNLRQLITRCVIFSTSRLAAIIIIAIIFYIASDLGKIIFREHIYILNLLTGSIIATLGITLLIPTTHHIIPHKHDNNNANGEVKCSNKTSLSNGNKNIFTLGFITGISPCAPRLIIIATAAIGSDNFYELIYKSLAFSVGEVLMPFVIVAGWWAASMGMKNFIPQKDTQQSILKVLRKAAGILLILSGVRFFFI